MADQKHKTEPRPSGSDQSRFITLDLHQAVGVQAEKASRQIERAAKRSFDALSASTNGPKTVAEILLGISRMRLGRVLSRAGESAIDGTFTRIRLLKGRAGLDISKVAGLTKGEILQTPTV